MKIQHQAVLIFCALLVALCQPSKADTIDTHTVVLDGGGKLMSWFTPQDKAYAHVAKLSADFIKAAMIGPIDPANGLPVIYTHSEYKQADFTGTGWPNNPAGKHAMLADSILLYYQYSGDSAVLDAVKALLDFQLRQFADDGAHPLGGTTPATYHWASVPWSCGAPGDIHFGTDGYSDGRFMIEPDKVGELGFHGYLRYFQITGETRYRDAAIACADALASHVRTGSATQSPWPFKVDARNNQLGSTPEDYCAHVIAPIRLFDELIRLNLGNVAAYQAARATAWNWMMTYPMTNNVWANYFEDDTAQANNLWNTNQYDPGQTARYFLEHPELDANWQTHVAGLLNYIETEFGFTDSGEGGAQYGPILISEQKIYTFKMGSHTSRFGAVSALYAERTGDAAAKEKAFRSLNWCTYMARNNGSVMEGPKEAIQNPPFWFTDGHGDYIRHFMLAMGAFPEWAPAGESHILRSTSVVKSVKYANTSISYSTFDTASTETLRVSGAVLGVTANGTALAKRTDLNAQGFTLNDSGVLRIRHDSATKIHITLAAAPAAGKPADRVSTVMNTPGCVAFWDFVKREPDGAHRFTAHVPKGATNNFPLEAGNYIKDYWGEGREATYADFPLLGRGPFGTAIRIRKEEDKTFRPFVFVPRERLHDSPIDIKGVAKSVSVVVWAIRESGNHALAGIWHEGTDSNHAGAAKVVARGQRQYALFAGLNKEGSACGHVSENGAKSFGHIYAMHKSNSGDVSPAVPADSPAGVLDASWQCFAMTYNHETRELTGWLNGQDTGRWQENVQKAIPVIHNAWLQGHLHREPGLQPGEDPNFPTDQFYNPPEDKPVSVKMLSETADERTELQEFRYTRVKVTRRKATDGTWTTAARDLADVRLNPWWFSHDSLYTPANDGTGGPFTIGRVIHSSRSVGFTGWIGGVAVFERALSAEEMGKLAAIRSAAPISTADR